MTSANDTGAMFRQALDLISLDEYGESFSGENDLAFAKRVFDSDPSFYETRVHDVGFTGLTHVLDAGCGYGQWSLVLAKSNRQVSAVDSSLERVGFLRQLANRVQVKNLTTGVSSITSLAADTHSFDAIFSYGVVFCTPWREALGEFFRVLKPGGLLYFTAVSIDWYAFLWRTQHNACADYDPRAIAASALSNSIQYDEGRDGWTGQVVMDPLMTVGHVRNLGFREAWIGPEGSLNLSQCSSAAILGDTSPRSLIDERGIFEVLARK